MIVDENSRQRGVGGALLAGVETAAAGKGIRTS